MPKIKWIGPKERPNGLKEMFQRHMHERRITSDELGKRMNVSGETVRGRLHRGIWSYRDIQDWCKALEITDAEEVGQAILYGVRR